MSFNADLTAVMQYAYNLFASAMPIVWLFIGGAFGLFMLGGLLGIFRR